MRKKIIMLFGMLLVGDLCLADQIKYKKPAAAEIKKKLTPLQFNVTQKEGTERAFDNEYWDQKTPGIYVDIVTGEPLFSSLDKFKSGTGWPSFTKPLEPEHVVTRTDRKLFVTRTEVRSKYGDSHLGHVFDDGPAPTGKRFCINSAALRFVPATELKAQGYEQYEPLFASKKANKTPDWQIATFAGGCFWCMEPPFEKLDGVKAAVSGYMGGKEKNPTYKQVSAGVTGHAEVVQVTYDANKVSYEKLLDTFWMNIDPTTENQQFVDRGAQYRSEIFFHTKEQQQAAEKSKKDLIKSKRFGEKPIVTQITKAGEFYKAEDYHQDYYKENPIRYKFYRYNSGRDQFLEKVWGEKKNKS